MKSAIESALDEWCLATGINFSISDEIAKDAAGNNILEANPQDNVNTITLEPISGSGAASLVTGAAYLEDCTSTITGQTNWYMRGIDFKIKDDADDWQSLKNNMLHEFGHAHMLQHSKDPNGTNTNNYLMYYDQTFINLNNLEASIKNKDNIGANTIFEASEEILIGGKHTVDGVLLDCIDPIGKGACNTLPVIEVENNNSFYLVPNPNNGVFTIHFSTEVIDYYKWELRTINGEVLLEEKASSNNQITVSTNIPLGVYIFTLFTKEGDVSKKVIIL